MAKKNKDIQVTIEETENTHELFINKKKIGVVKNEGKVFQAYADKDLLGNFKTLDDAVESIIRNWNLHQ